MSKEPTLVEIATANLRANGLGRTRAFLKACEVCADLWAHAWVLYDSGEWPTQAEYAAYWKISVPTVERQWKLFREAFPGERTPERLARWVVSEMGKRIEDGQALAVNVRVPDVAALAS